MFRLLDAYVELHLAGTAAAADARVPRMRAHLRGCSACRDDYDSLLALVIADQTDSSPLGLRLDHPVRDLA